MIRFYRTTEGIVVAITLYVLACYGLWSGAWILSSGPLIAGAAFAVAGLAIGFIGIYLFADAVTRLFEALLDTLGGFINEVMAA